jgi:hypothetical protein
MKKTSTSKNLLLGDTELYNQLSPNNTMPPTQLCSVPLGSHKKFLWNCERGHEWAATIGARLNGSNCPYCGNRKVLKGFNDLRTLKPDIATQWHPTKNEDLKPDEVVASSTKKVWWQCDEGHEWETPLRDRKNSSCPFCLNQRVWVGYNDLATTHPELAAQFHPTKNNSSPQEVIAGTGKSLWWICEKGHEWRAVGYERSKNGTGCPYCSGRLVLPDSSNSLASLFPGLVPQWHPTKNVVEPHEITSGTNQKTWWLCEKEHEWETQTYNRTGKSLKGCPTCNMNLSKMEESLAQIIQDFGVTVIRHSRKIIPPHEIDIYIPSKNLAVEFNGLYWHSEGKGKDRNYHHNKWKACKEKGIQLIQIWEDDWKNRPDIVKSMLAHKLGSNSKQKVPARKTQVVEVSQGEATTFLNTYHIQGAVDGSLRFGLKQGDELVAVMLLKREAGTEGKVLNLLRYATSTSVVGGFTKLLSFVERNNPTVTEVVTFSDNCVSDGGLYENNGFTAVRHIPPDYMYVVNGVREHKFGYRLKRFRNDPNLLFIDGYTEKQLAELNGLARVWDAGKTKWVKQL